MATIEELWQRLETWARAHAPEMLRDLNAPASGEAIDRLERTLALELPDAFRASLAVHDGESDGWPNRAWRDGGALLPCEEIPRFAQQLRAAHEQVGGEIDDPQQLIADGIISVKGPVKPVGFNPGWVPIMDSNGDTQWYLDFDPAPGGTPGQVIRVDPECCEWIVLATSFLALFEHYVGELEAGAFSRLVEGLPERPE